MPQLHKLASLDAKIQFLRTTAEFRRRPAYKRTQGGHRGRLKGARGALGRRAIAPLRKLTTSIAGVAVASESHPAVSEAYPIERIDQSSSVQDRCFR